MPISNFTEFNFFQSNESHRITTLAINGSVSILKFCGFFRVPYNGTHDFLPLSSICCNEKNQTCEKPDASILINEQSHLSFSRRECISQNTLEICSSIKSEPFFSTGAFIASMLVIFNIALIFAAILYSLKRSLKTTTAETQKLLA